MRKIIPKNASLIPDQAKLQFKGVIFDTYQWQQALFDGSMATFEMLRRPDTTQIICIVEDTILVLKDEQPHHGMRRGFPGGRVGDEDDSPLAAAQREVLEETGYEFSDWRLIKVWQPDRKIERFIYLFVAYGTATQSDTKLDAGEKITVEQLSFDELHRLVLDKAGYLGEVKDIIEQAKSLTALKALPEFTGEVVER